MLEQVLPRGHLGRFQLQAAIAAVHAEARTWEATDWREISLLYAMLDQAGAQPGGHPEPGRRRRDGLRPRPRARRAEPLLADPAMARHHRTHAVHAHLLEMAGERDRRSRRTPGRPG